MFTALAWLSLIMGILTCSFILCMPELRKPLLSRHPVWKALRSLSRTDEWIKINEDSNTWFHESGLMRISYEYGCLYVSEKPMFDFATKMFNRVDEQRLSFDAEAKAFLANILKAGVANSAVSKVDKALAFRKEKQKAEKADAEKLKSVNNIGSF